MNKNYQKNYAEGRPQMYDMKSREQKGIRIVKTLGDYFGSKNLSKLQVLDVGASTGIIDNVMAPFFKKLIGTDIDKKAIIYAKKNFKRKNLEFKVEDAMKLSFKNNSFDVVICTHVYEHVPNAQRLFDEIYRVLKPNGVCYLAAINAMWPWEPHYNLLFLSWLPKTLADKYVRLFKKAKNYYETPLTYWGIKNITKKFELINYTEKIIINPKKFGFADWNIENSLTKILSKFATYFLPTFFFLLKKPT